MRNSLAVASLLALLAAGHVSAQDRRHGAWGELGLGYGSASSSCETCSGGERLGGQALSFDAGATLNPHFRLGVGFRSWQNGLKAGGRLPSIDAIGLSLSYYHRTVNGPFMIGGAGLSHYDLCKGTGNLIDPCSKDPSYASGSGWGITLGAGWEIPAGRRTAVRPLLTFHHGWLGELHAPDGAVVATRWKQNVVTLEVAVLVELIP